jgi:hypothetical protein
MRAASRADVRRARGLRRSSATVHTARDRQLDMDTESVARHLCDVGSVSQIVWILSCQAQSRIDR